MYEIMNAHPLTIIIIIGSIMVTPFYIFAVYVFSGASQTKGAKIATAFLAFGAIMSLICLSDTPRKLGLAGNLLIPFVWLLPSLVLFIWRDWFLSHALSQRWLIGLQLFRVIGGVFLIEMLLGNLPGIFAYPAGVGDIFVAMVALMVLIISRNKTHISGRAVKLVIVLGLLDFMGAFFFGFSSSETPLQLFFPATPNNVTLFPTGMIPLFLVPYAIFFHTLSALNFYKFDLKKNQEVRFPVYKPPGLNS